MPSLPHDSVPPWVTSFSCQGLSHCNLHSRPLALQLPASAACALPCCALAKGASPIHSPPPCSCSRGLFLLVPVELAARKILVRLPGHLSSSATTSHCCLKPLPQPPCPELICAWLVSVVQVLSQDHWILLHLTLSPLAIAPLMLWCLPCLMAQRKIVTAAVCPCTTDYP